MSILNEDDEVLKSEAIDFLCMKGMTRAEMKSVSDDYSDAVAKVGQNENALLEFARTSKSFMEYRNRKMEK